ncbi:MAG: tricorn protease interacting factor [Acidimicrobiaceae bacterium]|nr:tricorn protease interacting factor [Acidimicrobiaceae bacterium]
MPENDPYRLPRTVSPVRYDLTLSPDLDAAAFAGEARIHVEVHEPVDAIVLNALELDITSAEVIAEADGAQHEGRVTLDEATERATIALPAALDAGTYTLHLTFTGTLNDKLRGFYRSTFTDDDGNERVIATTQFESTDARRAFPCWDEPDRKAVFGVTLVVDKGLTAVSNSPIAEEDDLGDGRRQVRFADTMKMSTYLVAFVVGPLESTDPIDVDGTPLRVVCVPGKSHLAGFALEVGAHSLRYFAKYFGIPYPGDKLDLIALPDFAMGAMENVGAVTFRENLLLIDTDLGTRGELERVADVIAHEIAHMWFGDLVTMKWWNGIWLNEAFATFMELLCVDDFRPEWDRWVTFGLTRGAAMVIDSLASTRPIEFPVGAPQEAEGMFDVLTYQKGAGVLRMLEQYLGDEAFRSGIARYIDTHQYSNTETTDLWDAIEAATGEPARATMDTWIFQGGYPVVSVEQGTDATDLVLSQRRFRYVEHDDDALWRVPVLIRASVAGEVVRQRVLLTERETTVRLPGKPDWVVVNAGGSGVYRVRYAAELLRALTTDVSHLDKLERFNLVGDTWASVLAGTTSPAEYVDLLRLFRDETDPAVWAVIVSGLGALRRAMPETDRPRLQRFVRELVGPQVTRLGWTPQPGESELDAELRGHLLLALGWLGADEAVIEQARQLHEQYLADPSSVEPNVADTVATLVARTGGEGDFQAFLDRWRHPSNPQEEMRYLYLLAEYRHPSLARRALDLAISEIRTQNGPFVIGYVLASDVNAGLAWDFIEEHWDDITTRFTEPLLPRMLDTISYITDPALAQRVKDFVAAHPLRSGHKSVEQAMERMDVNVAFAQRAGASLATAFDD